MWQFRKLGEGEPERSPHEAEFFNVGDLDASAALIREAIQNSLDARLTETNRYTFESLSIQNHDREEIPIIPNCLIMLKVVNSNLTAH
jgi:hypothetical protein